MKKHSADIQTNSYQASFQRLTENTIHMKRVLAREPGLDKVDIFGSYWVFMAAEIPEGALKVWDGETYRDVSGRCGAFFPAFSVSRWRLTTGTVDFEAIISKEPLPSYQPKLPSLFYNLRKMPQSVEDVFSIFSYSSPMPLDLDSFATPAARKARAMINTMFHEELPIGHISRVLKVPHASLTRTFQRAYGITPVGYRNQLRVFEATMMLLSDSKQPITSVSQDVGFRDLSRFNKQFKKINEATPRNYRMV